ncbi:MAG: hypothetical protein H7281_03745 [Bacteriovorax sp.]|nr:hypothetical protein [Bacteriovorax sp.]
MPLEYPIGTVGNILLQGLAMTEEELQKKRQDFRDSEVQNRIANLSSSEEYRQQTLKANYTRRVIKSDIGKMGWSLIIGQATFLFLFSSLFLISYIPKTKFLVTKIFP